MLHMLLTGFPKAPCGVIGARDVLAIQRAAVLCSLGLRRAFLCEAIDRWLQICFRHPWLPGKITKEPSSTKVRFPDGLGLRLIVFIFLTSVVPQMVLRCSSATSLDPLFAHKQPL